MNKGNWEETADEFRQRTDRETIATQAAQIEALRAEMKTLGQQLALLWVDMQGRAPAEKLQVIEALAKRANAAALSNTGKK